MSEFGWRRSCQTIVYLNSMHRVKCVSPAVRWSGSDELTLYCFDLKSKEEKSCVESCDVVKREFPWWVTRGSYRRGILYSPDPVIHIITTYLRCYCGSTSLADVECSIHCSWTKKAISERESVCYRPLGKSTGASLSGSMRREQTSFVPPIPSKNISLLLP